jgi:hypothetical protein
MNDDQKVRHMVASLGAIARAAAEAISSAKAEAAEVVAAKAELLAKMLEEVAPFLPALLGWSEAEGGPSSFEVLKGRALLIGQRQRNALYLVVVNGRPLLAERRFGHFPLLSQEFQDNAVTVDELTPAEAMERHWHLSEIITSLFSLLGTRTINALDSREALGELKDRLHLTSKLIWKGHKQ